MKRYAKRLAGMIIAVFLWEALYAQEAHFTQYFASPLIVNPANTGSFGGGLRAAANMRQQWFNVGYAYHTYSVSADATLMSDMAYPNMLAVGALVVSDESMGGALKTFSGALSLAYHKSLNSDGRSHLGLGMEATYTNKSVDFGKLTFASQYNGTGFDPILPANVNYIANSTANIDVAAGLLYSLGRDDDPVKLYAGGSVFHILQPEETIFNETASKTLRRYTAHGGAEIMIDEVSSVIFSGIYNRQGNADEKIAGGAYAFNTLIPETRLYAGLWHRLKESYMPYIGISTSKIMAGLNYSLPSKSVLSYRPRAFEFSLIFTLKSERSVGNTCPF